MYIQWCVKGIAGVSAAKSPNELTKARAFDLVASGEGIQCNWWRGKGTISPPEVAAVLNERNLDRHLHDYATFGSVTPFISLTAGCVERSVLLARNIIHSAIDTALFFATDAWAHPGALFYCWTPVGPNPAVEVQSVSESVRDLNVYRRWSPFQIEGEITAKIEVPANQISRVEWWDGSQRKDRAIDVLYNPAFVDPAPITNLRGFF